MVGSRERGPSRRVRGDTTTAFLILLGEHFINKHVGVLERFLTFAKEVTRTSQVQGYLAFEKERTPVVVAPRTRLDTPRTRLLALRRHLPTAHSHALDAPPCRLRRRRACDGVVDVTSVRVSCRRCLS